MIDNTLTYETPEGIVLGIETVSIILRGCAWFLDFFIRIAIVMIFGFLFSFFGEAGFGLIMVMGFFVLWLYPVFFEVLNEGQTIGKKICGIYVCMDNGLAIGWQASMIRNLLIVADFLPFGFCFGVLSSLFSFSNKRLGDWLAGTVVAYVPKREALPQILQKPPELPPISLTFAEQKAILSYSERYDSFGQGRKEELSAILVPMTGTPAEQKLLGYASAILGVEKKGKL